MENKKLVPLCLAANMRDARRIESVLDGAGVDYTFEITPLTGRSIFGIIFGTMKKGIMFLVPEETYEDCLKLLEDAGLSDLIIR
jgi:hypothetical protein